jgi:hypothetical protein
MISHGGGGGGGRSPTQLDHAKENGPEHACDSLLLKYTTGTVSISTRLSIDVHIHGPQLRNCDFGTVHGSEKSYGVIYILILTLRCIRCRSAQLV